MERPYQEQFHSKAIEMIKDCGKLEHLLQQILASIDVGEYHRVIESMSVANYYASRLAADLDVGELAVRGVIEGNGL